MTKAHFVTTPIIEPIGQMALMPSGIAGMVDWVKSRAPACVPDDIEGLSAFQVMASLFPHDLMREGSTPEALDPLSHNELLVELAGRGCYLSYGEKAGRKSNREYIEHTQEGVIPHRSITYHAKMSFFIAGISRRVSHELIRNYVGADRDEEGAPSQQSTRYAENPGFYVTPPRYLERGDANEQALTRFQDECSHNFEQYREQLLREFVAHKDRTGERPKGIAYKRILEAASGMLIHSVETSFIWTTNPGALAKLFLERDNDAADLEFRRLARKWKRVCMRHWPNLFPQPHMREGL